MKAIEIIQNIKNLKASGRTSDDNQMSDFQWLFIIDYYRAILLRRTYEKGYTINPECLQKLNPAKVTLSSNPIEKCELTTNELPRIIEGTKGTLLTFVGTEGGRSYQKTTYNKAQWDNQSKYVGLLPKYYQVGNKLTVRYHQKNLKLNIIGLFEEPIKVVEFNGELDEMNPFNFEYPLSNTMVDSVIKMIAESELKLSLLLPKDDLNDGRDGQ